MDKMFNTLKKIINKKNIKMVLIVRTDLKLSKGKTAAQCSHAAIICYEKSLDNNSANLKQWLRCGQPKIVLRIDSLSEMEELFVRADDLGVVAQLVRDAGRTQVDPGTVTVLGLGPDSNDVLDGITNGLKLL